MTSQELCFGMSEARIWAIVPAAGAGRRMGQPKQCLPYGTSTLIGAVVQELLTAKIAGIVVVTRSEIEKEMRLPPDPRVLIAYNGQPDSEMIDSIRIGLNELDGLQLAETSADCTTPHSTDGVLVVPADHPEINAPTYVRCMEAFFQHPGSIIVAVHAGRKGHPIIFPFEMRHHVQALPSGLNGLLDKYEHTVKRIELNDPGVLRDIDTPEQYKQLTDEV